MIRKNTFTIIVGCGRLGANIAGTLSDAGGSVTVIDQDERSFRKLSPSFGGLIVTGDGTDVSVLTDARIAKATALVAVTDRDNTNIMVAQLAKSLFGVPHVVARLYDPDRECVYQDCGIETISPVRLSTKEINKILKFDETAEGAE
ncbi:MAG: TrkA family potassium uptake protein [Oscillospiraceae bacterium]|nr:TrkA family potassium uptake protein [Oscillospiraceae bacterium]